MSTHTIIPSLIDALVAKARSIPEITATVWDGYASTEEGGDTFNIGIDDPTAESDANAANSHQVWIATNRRRAESGEVVCASTCIEGSGDMKVARDRAMSYVQAFEDAIRTDYSLGGVEGLLWVVGGETNYFSNNDEDGATATIVFRLEFEARI